MQKLLMLGAGFSPLERRMRAPSSENACEWVSLDANYKANPDVCFNLSLLHEERILPFADEEFDEIHAYEVLEHIGRQGNVVGFFAEFGEYWRILKPRGLLMGTCPARHSPWLWGDPSHSRVIQPETLHFLTEAAYSTLGQNAGSDFRGYIKGRYWSLEHSETVKDTYVFALRKTHAVAA